MTYRLGKRPARPGAIKFGFGQFFVAREFPPVPLVFGRPGLIASWGVLGNDKCGDCVWAGAAHETMLWRAWSGQQVPSFTEQSVVSDYAKNTGYDGTEPTDQGTDLQAAAAYRRQIGVVDDNGVRHRIDAYVALRPGNLDELTLAAYLFGAIGIGLELPSSALDQFSTEEPWAPIKGSPTEGGHYVALVGRNSHGNFLVVSWGRLLACTPEFLLEKMDEGIAYLSFEMLVNEVSPRGVDVEGLKSALATL